MSDWNKLTVIIILLGSVVSVCTRVSRPTRPSSEQILQTRPARFQRGMWVRAASMVSPDSIHKIIEIAKKYQITDIYAQVIVGGYAYYRSDILPRSQYLAKHAAPDYDPLDSLIHTAYACSIRVHAWVNTVLAWSLREPPDSVRHLYYTRPEWFIKDITQKSMIDYSADDWYDAGLEGMYLDPSNPRVREYLGNACAEILERYPVVGIHLDFIRYPGVWWGLPANDTTALFIGLDAYNIRWFNLLKYPQSTFITRWLCWHYWQYAKQKEKHIADMVQEINKIIKSDSLPGKRLLTAAIFPNPGLGRYRFAQDWMDWDQNIDYPVAMSYTDDPMFFSELLNFTIGKRKDAVFGIGFIWPDMEAAAFHEIEDVIKHNGAGISYFDFTSLDTMVDFVKLNGAGSTDEYSPLLPEQEPGLVNDVFSDLPAQAMVEQGKDHMSENEYIEFGEFLMSLSLNPDQDLKRMDITHAELLNRIRDDIAAFIILDSCVFPIADTLFEPPEKKVYYEFISWNDKDTAGVKAQAQNIKNLSEQINVYPNVMNALSRAAFSTEDNIRETLTVRRGIYVYKTEQVHAGDREVLRENIDQDLLPVFVNYTIKKKIEDIIDRY
jgi:uncharacterized lipoprotein YddW (UPF0748 family)